MTNMAALESQPLLFVHGISETEDLANNEYWEMCSANTHNMEFC